MPAARRAGVLSFRAPRVGSQPARGRSRQRSLWRRLGRTPPPSGVNIHTFIHPFIRSDVSMPPAPSQHARPPTGPGRPTLEPSSEGANQPAALAGSVRPRSAALGSAGQRSGAFGSVRIVRNEGRTGRAGCGRRPRRILARSGRRRAPRPMRSGLRPPRRRAG